MSSHMLSLEYFKVFVLTRNDVKIVNEYRRFYAIKKVFKVLAMMRLNKSVDIKPIN